MRVHCTAFWLPKEGNTDEEYEDAAFPAEAVTHEDIAEFKCAVADGATETSFAGLWAKLLVQGYCETFDLVKLRQEWNAHVKGKNLAWYAEEKLESGAFAALVGLKLTDQKQWEAEAIGDSCLIHARGKELLLSFPLKQSDEFNNSPALLSSMTADAPETLKETGEWQSGDVFILLSDAIARWTLKREEEHKDAILWLEDLNSAERLKAFADLERQTFDGEGRALMRNDDVTIVRVEVE